MKGRRIQAFLAAGLLVVLSGCSGLPMFASKPAPSPTLNILPRFYKANPAVPEQPAVYKTIGACYSLVAWKDFASTQNEYFRKGYELLGHCDFLGSTGMPLRDNAIDYGRYLGADVIIYTIQQTPEGESEHHISYLVSPVRFPNPPSTHLQK
ncbi:MAG TPA: hypothetical protein VE860_06735 [Chthoniobacterales bacterium]|jgi:hypothetical protein|nr:hypothetical protein [Chthoniobacterales bacterium]